MKHLRVISVSAILTILSFALVFYTTSCKKDPCAGVTCLNGGACGGGTCDCPSGYSGASCETPVNSIYAGSWSGRDCSGTATYTFEQTSYPSGVTMILQITGACGMTAYLKGTVDPISQNLTCPNQNFTNGCGDPMTISATGSIVSGQLSLNFVILSGGTITNCPFIGLK